MGEARNPGSDRRHDVAVALIGAAAVLGAAAISGFVAIQTRAVSVQLGSRAESAATATVTVTVTAPPDHTDGPIDGTESPDCLAEISFGLTINCRLDNPAQVRTHLFAGRAGQQVRLTVSKLAGTFLPAYEIHDPDGDRVCGGSQPAMTCQLEVDGDYKITVGTYSSSGTGRYSLSVVPLN